MNVLDMTIIRLAAGLVLLIAANIALCLLYTSDAADEERV